MRKIVTAVGAVCLLAASPAGAQVNTLVVDNPREEARLRIGPFYVSPVVELTELGYDNNVFNEGGQSRGDMLVSVTPEARVWLPVARRALVRADFGTQAVWYRRYASERSLNPQVSSIGEIYFRRFTLLGNASFVYSRQRPTFDLDLRARRKEVGYGGGVDVRLGPKLSLEVGARRSGVEFDGDAVFEGTEVQTTMNREGAAMSGTLRYRWTPLTSFSLSANTAYDDFELDPDRNNASRAVIAGVTFNPRALVSGSANVGVRSLRAERQGAFDDFSGLTADVLLAYTLLGSTTFSVTHRRDVVYSFDPLHPYFVENVVGAGVRRALGPRFDALTTVERHQYGYRNLSLATTVEPGLDVQPPERRTDSMWSVAGSVGYRVGRTARIGLGGTYIKRASSRPGRQFEGLRFGITGNYGL